MSFVRIVLKTFFAALCVASLGAALHVPAHAAPADDPCPLAVSFVCRFVPIAPDLDGDIDLTSPIPSTESDVPLPLPAPPPPVDVCAGGCV